MGTVLLIRPNNANDDAAADLYDWGSAFLAEVQHQGHTVVELDDTSPCDRATVDHALANAGADLVAFFGHGIDDALLGGFHASVIDANSAGATGTSLVAVACKAGLNLGPAAITSGFDAFLGWNCVLIWITPPAGRSKLGEAITEGLLELARGGDMAAMRTALADKLADVAQHYDTGPGANDPEPDCTIGYLGALAAAAHIALDGDATATPL